MAFPAMGHCHTGALAPLNFESFSLDMNNTWPSKVSKAQKNLKIHENELTARGPHGTQAEPFTVLPTNFIGLPGHRFVLQYLYGLPMRPDKPMILIGPIMVTPLSCKPAKDSTEVIFRRSHAQTY